MKHWLARDNTNQNLCVKDAYFLLNLNLNLNPNLNLKLIFKQELLNLSLGLVLSFYLVLNHNLDHMQDTLN